MANKPGLHLQTRTDAEAVHGCAGASDVNADVHQTFPQAAACGQHGVT